MVPHTFVLSPGPLLGSEVLLAVFGRAGPLSRHDPRQVIHSIGFVLFDSVTGIIRVHGVRKTTNKHMLCLTVVHTTAAR